MGSGYCNFCQVWHSGSCCHPARPVSSDALYIAPIAAVSPEMYALALKALESIGNDTRSETQIIEDGVDFICHSTDA